MNKSILLPLVACIGLSSKLLAEPIYDTSIPSAHHMLPPVTSYPYIGGAFSFAKVEDNFVDFVLPRNSETTDIDYTSAMFQAGYQYSSFFAVEFRYWTAIDEGDYETNSIDTSPSSYESFDAWGLYLKPIYPLTPLVDIYGLVGFSSTSVDGAFIGEDILINASDFSWGFGTAFILTHHISVFLDYVSLFDDRFDTFDTIQDTRVDTFNFGLTYKF